jgi:hypothetical protein
MVNPLNDTFIGSVKTKLKLTDAPLASEPAATETNGAPHGVEPVALESVTPPGMLETTTSIGPAVLDEPIFVSVIWYDTA